MSVLASDYFMAVLRAVRDDPAQAGNFPVPPAGYGPAFGSLRERGMIEGEFGFPRITFLGRVVLAAHEDKEQQR